MRFFKLLLFLAFILRLSTAQSQTNTPLYLAGELTAQEVKIFDFLRETYSKPYFEKSNALTKQAEVLESAVKRGEAQADSLKKLEQERHLLFQQVGKLYDDLNRRAEAYTLIKPEQESPLFLSALDTFLNGHVQAAESMLETAHNQRLADVHTNLLLADIYTLQFENAKAAACFESAIRMDTTDYTSLYAYAIFLKITGKFDPAHTCLEKIQKISAATDWQMAQAYDLRGQIYQETKSLDRAARAYQQYLAILKQFIRLNPEDRFYKKCLADLYYRLGYTYKEQVFLEPNRMIDTRVYIDTALIYFKKRTQVWEELFRIDPEYEVRNSSLYIAYETVSNLLFLYSDMDSSIQYYLKNAEMLELLHRKHPDNMLLTYNLFIVYSCLASEYSEQQQAEKVIEYNRKLINIDVVINRILEKNDSAKINYVQYFENKEIIYQHFINKDIRESIKTSFFECIARTYNDVNQLDSAAFYYTKKINLYKDLIINDSSFNRCASNLASTYSDLGNIYKIQGKLDTALGCAFEEVTIYKKVLQPSSKDKYLDKIALARCYGKIGDLYQMQGKLDSALSCFSRAAQTTVELFYEYPQGSSYKSILAESYAKTGAVYALWDQKEKAIEYVEKAIELYKQLFVAFAWEKYKENYEDLECEVISLKSK